MKTIRLLLALALACATPLRAADKTVHDFPLKAAPALTDELLGWDATAAATRKFTLSGIATALGTSYQPLDSDLTAIAALTTTAYGRSLLTPADAAAARALLGAGTGSGTVTSVGMTVPSWLSITGSPITVSGTLAMGVTSQAAGLFLASPSGGAGVLAPRAIVAGDLPALPYLSTVGPDTLTLSGIGGTPTMGLRLVNSTEGASGTPQLSPSLSLKGGGYDFFGITTNDFSLLTRPGADGTGNAPGFLEFRYSANGGFPTLLVASLSNLGSLTVNDVNGVVLSGAGTLAIGGGGTLGSAAFTNSTAYEVPLTFSTGLTRTANTITVNAVQSLTRLSNLTANGFVKTSGANGTLSVDTATYAPAAQGVSSLTLNTAGVLHSTPITFTNTGGAWAGTTTLIAQAANTVFGNFTAGVAAPTFTAAPTFSAANLTSFPTLNQNTTGSAAKLTTARTINGVSFDGTANVITQGLAFFGGGTDGALAAGFANATSGDGTHGGGAAGTYTLTRDVYFTNLTFGTGDKLICKSFKVFVSGILDITAADAGAIVAVVGTSGGNAAGATAGTASANAGNGTTSGANPGVVGKTGGTGVGTAGAAGGISSPSNGGKGGNSGAGGAGTAGAGGATANANAPASALPILRAETNLLRGNSLISGGGAGSTGGAGAGTGALAGGGSGGGGGGGNLGAIYAATINRGGATAAGCIQFTGGNGGNGGASPNAAAGGGGGSGGGGGGWIYLVFGTLTGSTATNALDASGGTGGNGGAGNTTGNGGNGADGGNGGRITVINLGAATVTSLDNTGTAGTAGTAASGVTAGAGGAGASTRLDL